MIAFEQPEFSAKPKIFDELEFERVVEIEFENQTIQFDEVLDSKKSNFYDWSIVGPFPWTQKNDILEVKFGRKKALLIWINMLK